MPEFLDRAVIDRTTIQNRYAESASWQSMDRYLADWHRAQHRLNRQIAELTKLRDERRDAADRGDWPPRDNGTRKRHDEAPDNGSASPCGPRDFCKSDPPCDGPCEWPDVGLDSGGSEATP